MKEFLSYMKSTLLAAGKLCSARRALHCKLRLLSTARIASLALVLALCSCQDNDSPFRSVIPDEDDDYVFAIKPLPIQGEEIPYGDSRALNPMSVDKENMIKQIAIFQYDAENNLRMLKDGSGYFIYVDFTNKKPEDNTTTDFTPAEKGYTRVTENELPPLSTVLWTSTSSSLKTCVIANVPRSMVESALFPNGKNSTPADWAEFQQTSFDLPFLTEEEVDADKLISGGEKELGHLNDIYMFGYFEGTVPYTGFTLGLGRTVARLKVTFSVEDTKKIDPDARFYAAVSNLGRQSSYFIKMDANSEPNISEAYLLDPERFDLSTGEAVIQFYGGPKVNEIINDPSEATTLLLWYVRPDDDGKYGIPDPTSSDPATVEKWMKQAVKVPFGNAPKEGNYGIVRNTLYSFRLPLIFTSTGFGIEYMYSSTLRAEGASPLPWTATSWNVNLYMDGENDSHPDTGTSHLKVDWNDDIWKGKMIKFYYTYDTDNTYNEDYCNAKFATDPPSDGWSDLPGYSENIGLETTSGTFDIILTDDVLNQIRQDGELIVYGYHYTITKIEIWEEGYTSAAPVAGNFTFAIVDNSNNEWDWEHRGYMEGTTEHPYALSLGATNSKGSDFLISNLLNTSSSADKIAKYGVVDYVIYNEEGKTFKLVDKPYAKRQIQFDFSQLTYAVKTGTGEISGDYIKIVDNALLPLQPTTGLSSGQEVIFYVTIDEGYPVGKKEGNTPESFNVTSRTVPVKVTIANAFSHMLTPTSSLGRIETSGTSIATFIGDKTFTATKSYFGEEVKSVTGVPYSDLSLKSTGAITDQNGNAIDGVSITDGNITFPDNFSGTVYLHFDVDNSVASTHDLKTYHYTDILLPIKVGAAQPLVLTAPWFPIGGVNIGTLNWGEDGNVNIAEYDQTSKTITFKKEWGGYGWQGLDGVNLSAYTSIAIEFENPNPTDMELGLNVIYTEKDKNGNNLKDESGYKQVSTEKTLTCKIDNSKTISYIVFQNNKPGSVRIKSVTLYPEGYTPPTPQDPTTPTYEGISVGISNGDPVVMASGWTQNITIESDIWTRQDIDLAKDDVIRFYVSDIQSGAQLGLQTAGGANGVVENNYIDISGLSGSYYDLTVTEAQATLLRSSGLKVSGQGYTLNQVTVIKNIPATTIDKTLSYTFTLFRTEPNNNYNWGDKAQYGGTALSLGELGTDFDITHLLNYDTSLSGTYGYIAHTLENVDGSEYNYVELKKSGQVQSGQQEYDFSGLSYTTTDSHISISSDNKLTPLSAGEATFYVNMNTVPTGYTNIASPASVPVTVTIANSFSYEMAPTGSIPGSLGEDSTPLYDFLASANFNAIKKYKNVEILAEAITLSTENCQVTTSDENLVYFDNGNLVVPTGATGSPSITFTYTVPSDLQSQGFPATLSYTHTVNVGAPSEITVWDEGESNQLELTQTNAPDLLKNAKVGAKVRAYVKEVNESGATGQFLSAWYQAYNGYDSIEISPSDEYIEMLIEDYMITEDSSKASIDRLGLVIKTTNCKVYKVTIIPAP